jgi:hypothetical protein
MKIGHARINLTPAEGSTFYLLGYRNPIRNEPAKGIHDPIFANALLFDDGTDPVFLWTADLLELPDQTAEVIKTKLSDRFGISRDHVLLGVTHDHSSIRDFHISWPYGKFSQDYYDFFISSVLSAYAVCLDNEQEARCHIGRKVIDGYYGNRNHPGEQADNEVIVLQFTDREGKPFAGLVNWAVHSAVMGASNAYLTGDLAGNTCALLKEKWGYYPLFLNGAAGDSSNRWQRQGSGFDELMREAEGLADAIAAIESKDEVNLGEIRYQTLSHTIAPDPERLKEHLLREREALQNGTMKPVGNMPVENLVQKCEEQLAAPPFFDTLCFEVLDIGDLRFYTFPGELGSVFGKQLKAASDKTALIAGYTNGFHYYFLAAEDYGISFETIGCPVPKGEAEKIEAKLEQSGRFLSSVS